MIRHASINLNALQHNLQQARNLAPNSKILSMVKANAYGHGLIPVAQALKKTDAFGVACLAEALQLNESSINKPIAIMQGFFSTNDLKTIAENKFEAVIHDMNQIKMLEKTKLSQPIKVWLKIDTGMHRLGIEPEKATHAWQLLQNNQNVQNHPVLMTHFSDSDDNSNQHTQEQIKRFTNATNTLPGAQSLANSAAIIHLSETHCDWVRPGIMLYGASPFIDLSDNTAQLKPVMTLQSEVIAVKKINKGESVGYGSTWTAPCETTIGVVSIGYGDGYPRHAKNGTPVLINNQIAPLVGRVSMDMITVNLHNHHNAKPGDKAILWGEGLPAETVAQHADTISYELFCQVTNRVRLEYV